jgi:hypothetical protein
MARAQQIIINGEKWCPAHKTMHPAGDFERTKSRQSGELEIPTLRTNCRRAEREERDRNRAANPGYESMVGRATRFARQLSKALGVTISYHWVLTELHWIGLVPYLDAATSRTGTCLNCGQHHDDAERYEMAHLIPAPHLAAWPYQHARNFTLRDHGCNGNQATAPHDPDYLEEQHRWWVGVRHWSDHAGEKGWPPYDPSWGPLPGPALVVDGPADQWGRPTLF